MLARFHQIIDAVFMKSVVLLVNHDIQLAKDIIVPVSAATPYMQNNQFIERFRRTETMMASNQPPSTQLLTPVCQ